MAEAGTQERDGRGPGGQISPGCLSDPPVGLHFEGARSALQWHRASGWHNFKWRNFNYPALSVAALSVAALSGATLSGAALSGSALFFRVLWFGELEMFDGKEEKEMCSLKSC